MEVLRCLACLYNKQCTVSAMIFVLFDQVIIKVVVVLGEQMEKTWQREDVSRSV